MGLVLLSLPSNTTMAAMPLLQVEWVWPEQVLVTRTGSTRLIRLPNIIPLARVE